VVVHRDPDAGPDIGGVMPDGTRRLEEGGGPCIEIGCIGVVAESISVLALYLIGGDAIRARASCVETAGVVIGVCHGMNCVAALTRCGVD